MAATLALSACGGSKVGSSSTGATGGSSCVKTDGDTIKIGFLNSRSGTMAISENTVYDSLVMAKDEINTAGGVNGKPLEGVAEDGASEPTTFAEKAQKLISSDCVAAVFGGWTSARRKAMLPVFEGNNSLLFYPVQYEGLEASKNIFYTGATTNQQIIPGPGLPEGEGRHERRRTRGGRRPAQAGRRRSDRDPRRARHGLHAAVGRLGHGAAPGQGAHEGSVAEVRADAVVQEVYLGRVQEPVERR